MSCPKLRFEVNPGCNCHLHSSTRGFTKKDHRPKDTQEHPMPCCASGYLV